MNKRVFNFKNAVCCGVYTESFSGAIKEYGDFTSPSLKSGFTRFGFDNGKCKLFLDYARNIVFAETKRVKKIAIRFRFKDDGAVFYVHNESVTDLTESGLKVTPQKGKSAYFLCVKNGGGDLNFANVLPCRFVSYFDYRKAGGFYYVDFVTEYPRSYKGKFRSEKLIFSDDESSVALEKFAGERKEFDKPVGWSTWDYYFTDINEKVVRENVDFIAGDGVLSEKIKYIAIDDGWQQSEGFWKEGAAFPSGLKTTVGYIKEKGFEAGIWTCPVRLNTMCPTVMRRNDFLAKNKYGDPIVYDGFYVLDITHPDGEKFIKETFDYLFSIGFTFYKIDFIGHILACESFYDKTAGPFDVIRRLLTLIRESVGNSHILGCNMPYGVGYGYVDSRRTGLDVHNVYGHVIKCAEIFAPQFAAQNRIYRNDLDYVIVRGEETSVKDEYNALNPTRGFWKKHTPEKFVWRYGKDFSYVEAKSWCALQLIVGSSLFLGDRLIKLNEKGLKLIKTTLAYADFESGYPEKLFDSPVSSVWRKEKAVAVFNFGDVEKTFCVDRLTAKKYKDAFTEQSFFTENNLLRITLLPHDCVYLTESYV